MTYSAYKRVMVSSLLYSGSRGQSGFGITPMGNTLRAPATPVNNVLTFTMIGPSKAAPRVEMGSIGAVSRRRCVAALPRACNPLASV